jgi:S1-C subfamily serine protease
MGVSRPWLPGGACLCSDVLLASWGSESKVVIVMQTQAVKTEPMKAAPDPRLVSDDRRRAATIVRSLVAALIAAGVAPRAVLAQSQSSETQERIRHATVMVITAVSKSTEGDTPMGSGSGYFINRTGLCITNNHVVDPTHGKSRWEKQREAYMELNRLVWKVVVDGGTEQEKVYQAFVLYQNDKADQAILQVRDEDGGFLSTPDFLRLRPGRTVDVGLKAWCYGFPGGDARKSGKDQEHPAAAISEGHVVDSWPTPATAVVRWSTSTGT